VVACEVNGGRGFIVEISKIDGNGLFGVFASNNASAGFDFDGVGFCVAFKVGAGDTFTYTSSNTTFTLDNNKLKLNAALDYEASTSLSTTITVTDNGLFGVFASNNASAGFDFDGVGFCVAFKVGGGAVEG
jgi:hypothetical protein